MLPLSTKGGGQLGVKGRVYAWGCRTGEVPEADGAVMAEGVEIHSSGKPACARRKMFRQLPFGHVPGLVPSCRDSNHAPTQVDALSRRLCRSLPPIDPSTLTCFSSYVQSWCERNLTPIPAGGLMTFEEWLESTNYPGSRKEELRRVYAEGHGAIPSKAKASKVSAFIKSESYPIGPVIKPARWICSRKDVSKVILGPVFKTIEREVYHDKHFVKHTPVAERPAAISGLRKAGTRYIVTDYTAFEASFDSKLMLACEAQMYTYMLKNYPELARFVERTITGENSISTRQGVSVKLRGRRMSGDMCTSLGNGFTNLMLMGFFCERVGSSWDGFVEGDDGIFGIQGAVPAASDFASLGFEIKLAEIRDPSLGGFCGVVAAGDQVIRDPVRFFQTFGWTSTSIEGGKRVMMGLLRAKALSALYEAPACPIVSATARRALELTHGFEPRWEWHGYHVPPPKNFDPVEVEIRPESRDLFAELYGISVECQLRAEAALKTAIDLQFLDPILQRHHNHALMDAWFIGG